MALNTYCTAPQTQDAEIKTTKFDHGKAVIYIKKTERFRNILLFDLLNSKNNSATFIQLLKDIFMEQSEPTLTRAKTVRFIKDTAAEEDFFGTHERIAGAISSVIQTHEELKVLGLVGPWGSGKSTLIKLTEKSLKEDSSKETRFFIYDAWLHQSDPPRRSFIERLVDFFGLSEDEKWKVKLAELNGQIDDSETKTTPTLTKAGRWILLSLFLLPIGFAFVGHDWLPVWVSTPWFSFKISVFWTGMVILLLPAVVASTIYLAWRPTCNPFASKYSFWKAENWTTHKSPNEKDSILTLFMNKAITRENHRTTKSPDPTTIEFQKIFRELIQSMSDPKKRYVLVIDNLDRLPEEMAIELWATIRSFFLGVQQSGQSYSLPTVLLPIDPEAVKRMYEPKHESEAPKLAQAFMDKTFDLTFRIPPPVFSDWQKYIAKQLNFAFHTECNNEWIYQVTTLYENFVTTVERGDITPRLINTLINSIAVLWLQWKGEIPFAIVACFAIYRDQIHKDVGAFIRESRPDFERFDNNWAAGVAALYFGVPVENALQIQMEIPLIRAIQEGNSSDFKKQSETPGFDFVFERVLEKGTKDPEFSANASELFDKLKLPKDVWVDSAWSRIVKRMSLAPPWKTMNERHAAGLAAMVRNCAIPDIPSCIKSITSSIEKIEPTLVTTKTFVGNWAAAATAISAEVTSRIGNLPMIRFPGEAPVYLELVGYFDEQPDILKKIQTSASDVSIITELARQLGDADLAADVDAKFDSLVAVRTNWPWKPLIEVSNTKIRGEGLATAGVAEAIHCLCRLYKIDNVNVSPLLKALSSEGFLFERYNEAHQAKSFEAEAELLALIVVLNPKFENPGDQGRAQAGKALTNSFEDTLKDRKEVIGLVDKKLDQIAVSSSFSALYSAASSNASFMPIANAICMKRLSERRLGPLPISSIITKVTNYLSLFDVDRHAFFVEALSDYPTFWETLAKTPLEASAVFIYGTLVSSENSELSVQAKDTLHERLLSIGIEEWKLAVSAGKEPLVIAQLLMDRGMSLELGQALFDALSSLSSDVLTKADTRLAQRWIEASIFLKSNSRHILLKSLRDQLLVPSSVPSRLIVLQAGGEMLLDDGHFDEKPDDTIRYLVTPLLDDQVGIEWLSAKMDRTEKWLNSAEKETQGFLHERVSEIWSKGENGVKDRTKALGNGWQMTDMPWDAPEASLEVGNGEPA